MSFPPGTEMFQFPGFALKTLCVQVSSTCSGDLSFACHAPCNQRRAQTRPQVARSAIGQTTNHRQVGCPIRRSRDQRVLSPPPGLSQSATSFIASCRLGIHQTPLLRLIRSGRRRIGRHDSQPLRPWTRLSAGHGPHPREGTTRPASVSALDLERLFLSVLPLASLAA